MSNVGGVPDQIGPYRVTGYLGKGGMGEVVRGYDDRLRRSVALKRILTGARDPDKALERFRREARAIAQLSHPSIVQVFDWVDWEGQNWLVMELVEGRLLEEMVAEGPLSPSQAMAIASEVAAGLSAAHSIGLVHRDLKASNIIVMQPTSGSGGLTSTRVKILDFGLAKAVTDGEMLAQNITADGVLVGTLTAMSPEQAKGLPVDHRSDLFSLGVLLFEMLTGQSPFRGPTAVETLTRICNEKARPLRQLAPWVPESLAQLVARLLEKEKANRPADAGEVVADLDRILRAWATNRKVNSGDPEAPTKEEFSFEGLRLSSTSLNGEAKAFEGQVEVGTGRAAAVFSLSGRRWWRPLGVFLLIVTGSLLFVPMGMRWLAGQRDAQDRQKVALLAESQLSSHELCLRAKGLLDRYDLKGNIDAAIADFQRALAQDPSSSSALAGLADAYRLDYFRGNRDPQRLEQALAAAQRAVEFDEYLAMARVSLGMVYVEKGRPLEAGLQFEKALQIEPSNGEARYGLGRVAELNGDLPEAEDHYRQAIEAQPDKWPFHSRLGSIFYQAGRYEEAETLFLRHIELTPDSAVAYRNLGANFYMQGRLPEAASQFQKALQIQPDPPTYGNLGTIYFTQGLYPEAVSVFEKAITDGGANDYLMWGNLADAYRWTPDKSENAREAYLHALKLLAEKLVAKPRDSTLQTRRIIYLAKSGECSQTLAEMAEFGNPSAGDGYAWYRIAVANEVCARREPALSALATALKAGFSIQEIRQDPELMKLRQDVRFHRLAIHTQ